MEEQTQLMAKTVVSGEKPVTWKDAVSQEVIILLEKYADIPFKERPDVFADLAQDLSDLDEAHRAEFLLYMIIFLNHGPRV